MVDAVGPWPVLVNGLERSRAHLIGAQLANGLAQDLDILCFPVGIPVMNFSSARRAS